jgi:hypothetical protein
MSKDLVHLEKLFKIDFLRNGKFYSVDKIHGIIRRPTWVELEFFEIFLPYSFRLIGPQTKQGNMHLAQPK